MRIIVIGTGKLGYQIAETLSKEKYDLVVIDNDSDVTDRISESLDVLTIHANGLLAEPLKELRLNKEDLVIAVTGSDEGNILACMSAKSLGAGWTIARIRDPEYTRDLAVSQEQLCMIITLFMFVSGVNFSLYYGVIHRKMGILFRDDEFRFYWGTVLAASLLIALNIASLYQWQLGKIIRDSFFQVVSMVTTTGFVTVDYEKWPELSKMVLFMLMFMGGCAGSTGGAIKQVRVLLILKAVKRKLTRLIHPKAVIPIVLGDSPVSEETVDDILLFTLLYLLVFVVVSMLLLTQGLDMLSSTSAVAATLGNVGPGFGLVGPTSNFAALTTLTKVLLSFCMLLGRLEIYPIVALAMPNFWRKA